MHRRLVNQLILDVQWVGGGALRVPWEHKQYSNHTWECLGTHTDIPLEGVLEEGRRGPMYGDRRRRDSGW